MSSPSIDRARKEIDAAWLRSDADGITQHLAEDAVLMPPHDTKKVGRQSINTWLRGFFEHYAMTDLTMPEREVTVAGDWAIERSLYEWTLRPKDGSAPIQDQANWIGIWRPRSRRGLERGVRYVEQHASGACGDSCVIWRPS